MIVDILGREIKVRDIVVATNNSSVYPQIHVVTRLGSENRVQLNGSSYAMAEYLMVCTEQYVIQKGQKEADTFVNKCAEFFDDEQVVKKLPPPRFVVSRICHYTTYKDGKSIRDPRPRFFVIQVQGTNQDCFKQLNEFQAKQNITIKDPDRKYLKENKPKEYASDYYRVGMFWVYHDIKHAVSLRQLKEWGLDAFINQEVPFDHPKYGQLQNYEER